MNEHPRWGYDTEYPQNELGPKGAESTEYPQNELGPKGSDEY